MKIMVILGMFLMPEITFFIFGFYEKILIL